MNRYIVILIAGLVLGCTPQSADPVPDGVSAEVMDLSGTALPQTLASAHLPNPVLIHPKVISGGLPESDEAFQELVDLGVKTIISVDGAKPDVAAARKFSLRYVHLPHGYDGIPDQRVKELAKAVRDLEGPIYIHCHHGKHRSPAAASVACVSAGLTPPSQAIAVLQVAGTSPNYRGLFQAADRAVPLEQALLDELQVEFRETVQVPPMAEAMVAIEHTQDHLKQIAAAGWKTPADHADLDPAHTALLMREHFTELLRTDAAGEQSDAFRQMLVSSQQAAGELETALLHWDASSGEAVPPSVEQSAKRIADNCKSCHVRFRDVPP
ncbi:hypothetical protein NHH03_08080 [Stieleria sp. TO1_6]|uniref:hypothetical protein n=1 Tax=Stieleria tagensis TaxID=2956795 RepID=UPI00209B81C3|nr:hypothetical protein [Stieleria tagensis]MCO8121690.1 hypothetical protein [Stieleria tagensis]